MNIYFYFNSKLYSVAFKCSHKKKWGRGQPCYFHFTLALHPLFKRNLTMYNPREREREIERGGGADERTNRQSNIQNIYIHETRALSDCFST